MAVAAALIAVASVWSPVGLAPRAAAQSSFPDQRLLGPFVGPAPDHLAQYLGRLDRLCTPSSSPSPSAAPPPAGQAPPGLSVVQSFAGLSKKQAPKSVSLTASADTSGAVGPDHYMQAVNVGIGIFTRAGALVCPPLAQPAVFANPSVASQCDTGDITDAVVLYDSHAGRWVVSLGFRNRRIEVNGVHHDVRTQCVAVSESSDPTAAYNRYEFQISGVDECSNDANRFASCEGDYPKLGIWPDGYYLTAAARATIGNYNGIYVLALERDAMLAGRDARSVEFYLPNPTGTTTPGSLSHMLPGDWDGPEPPPAGSPNPFGQGFAKGMIGLWNFTVDWTNPEASTFGVKDAGSGTATPNAGFTDLGFNGDECGTGAPSNADAPGGEEADAGPDCIPQPPVGGKEAKPLSAVNQGHLMFRLAYRNRGGAESLLTNLAVGGPDVAPPAAIRWYQFTKSGDDPWGIGQQGTYGPDDGRGRWLGSMAMDGAGDILLGFSASGADLFPSIHYAGRTPDDPPGELPVGEGTLVVGQGSKLEGGSFGDYTHMAVDPTDDCTLWFTSQYYASQADADAQSFSTHVGAFRFAGCPASRAPTGTTGGPAGADDVTVGARTLAATGGPPAALVVGLLLVATGAAGLLLRRAARR